MLMDPKWMRYYAIVSSAVIFKIVLTVGGFFIGSALDGRWHTYPWMTLLGVIVGVSIGMTYVIYVATKKRD